MAKKLYEEASVQDIAKAIREKNGGTTKYTIGEMGAAIKALSGETETYTFSQERAEVSKFLSEVTYNPTDYTTSLIPNYVTTTSSNRPEGVSIQIKKERTSRQTECILFCNRYNLLHQYIDQNYFLVLKLFVTSQLLTESLNLHYFE